MNCETIDILIRRELETGLSASDRRTLDLHVAGCARCRELLGSDLEPRALAPPAGLIEAVLRETSGSPCARASELLCGQLDGELDTLDAELVTAHADRCTECASLRTVLLRTTEDLTGMRELEPHPRFVEQVLDLTSRGRARALWHRLVRRPRFAWEAAYVGAMLFWLVLGAPLSRGSEQLRQVLPELQRSSASLAALRGDVSSLGRRAWDSAGGAWSSSISRIESDLGDRSARAQGAITGVKQHSVELRQAIATLDLGQSGRAVKGMTREAREVVNKLIRDESRPEE